MVHGLGQIQRQAPMPPTLPVSPLPWLDLLPGGSQQAISWSPCGSFSPLQSTNPHSIQSEPSKVWAPPHQSQPKTLYWFPCVYGSTVIKEVPRAIRCLIAEQISSCTMLMYTSPPHLLSWDVAFSRTQFGRHWLNMPYAILWNLMPTYTSSPLPFTYAVPLTGMPFLVFSIAYLIPTYLSRLLNRAFSRKPILATPTHFSFLALQAVPVSHLSVIEY